MDHMGIQIFRHGVFYPLKHPSASVSPGNHLAIRRRLFLQKNCYQNSLLHLRLSRENHRKTGGGNLLAVNDLWHHFFAFFYRKMLTRVAVL